jgi:hypothetical protein
MTEEEMDKLADLIVKKIMEKQVEYDAEFLREISQDDLKNMEISFPHQKNDIIKSQILALEDILKVHLNNEDYESAARCVENINFLRSQIK